MVLLFLLRHSRFIPFNWLACCWYVFFKILFLFSFFFENNTSLSSNLSCLTLGQPQWLSWEIGFQKIHEVLSWVFGMPTPQWVILWAPYFLVQHSAVRSFFPFRSPLFFFFFLFFFLSLRFLFCPHLFFSRLPLIMEPTSVCSSLLFSSDPLQLACMGMIGQWRFTCLVV